MFWSNDWYLMAYRWWWNYGISQFCSIWISILFVAICRSNLLLVLDVKMLSNSQWSLAHVTGYYILQKAGFNSQVFTTGLRRKMMMVKTYLTETLELQHSTWQHDDSASPRTQPAPCSLQRKWDARHRFQWHKPRCKHRRSWHMGREWSLRSRSWACPWRRWWW